MKRCAAAAAMVAALSSCSGGLNPVAIIPDPLVPVLESPRPGEVLDNGCRAGGDPIVWDFRWQPVAGATQYHLIVLGPGNALPLVDNATLGRPSFHHARVAWVPEPNRLGWEWRVRARVNGLWGDYSAPERFDVEPVDSDCR